MPVASTRVTDDFYERIKDEAVDHDVSISDFIRKAIELAVDNRASETQQSFDVFRSELDQKNEQIQHLHQLLALTQNNLSELTSQLNRAHLQLADPRGRKWWEFFRRG